MGDPHYRPLRTVCFSLLEKVWESNFVVGVHRRSCVLRWASESPTRPWTAEVVHNVSRFKSSSHPPSVPSVLSTSKQQCPFTTVLLSFFDSIRVQIRSDPNTTKRQKVNELNQSRWADSFKSELADNTTTLTAYGLNILGGSNFPRFN